MASREVVRAVEYDIHGRNKLFKFLLLKFFRNDLHVHFRVEQGQGFPGFLDFRSADGVGAVEDLPLQVGEVDLVGIGDRQPPDAGSGEIERRGAAQATRADDQRGGAAQSLLTLDPDFGKEDVAAVAEELLIVQSGDGLVSWAWCSGRRRAAWYWRAWAAGL
jgi:hypothetical protein